jgi:hypothetical protein
MNRIYKCRMESMLDNQVTERFNVRLRCVGVVIGKIQMSGKFSRVHRYIVTNIDI